MNTAAASTARPSVKRDGRVTVNGATVGRVDRYVSPDGTNVHYAPHTLDNRPIIPGVYRLRRDAVAALLAAAAPLPSRRGGAVARYTITDAAVGRTIATGADRWDAADAVRGAFPDAPADVAAVAERAAAALESGDRPAAEDCAFLALSVDAD